MEPFRLTRRVDFCDTDMAGIMHFSNFFRFMEAAEVAFLRTRGLGVQMLDWPDGPIAFPRVSATCDYLKPARFEELIDIDVRLERLGSKSVTYAFEFSRAGDVIARGKVTSVCCRVAGHELRGIEVPEEYRRRLQGI